MGGTKAKPHIACADKECGYKRAIDEPGDALPPSPEPGKLGPAPEVAMPA